jgi:hypothetical protein
MEKVLKYPAAGDSDSILLVIEPLVLKIELVDEYEGSRW